jgi:hypothetical protein
LGSDMDRGLFWKHRNNLASLGSNTELQECAKREEQR